MKGIGKEKVRMLGSTDIDTIYNSDIYDTYKDIYLGKKKGQGSYFQE